jgi:ribosome-associated protein
MDDWQEQDEELAPSKSARKRQMTALQKLGEELVKLSERELVRIPVEDSRLLETIREARVIKSHSARRRHLQFLGKLMRSVDPEPIEAALNTLHQQRQEEAKAFRELEAWRDTLLQEGDSAVPGLLQRFPGADRQQIRQLLRQHKREAATGKPLAARRKLFRYLRELTQPG